MTEESEERLKQILVAKSLELKKEKLKYQILAAKELIEKGEIKTLFDLYQFVPKKWIAKTLNFHPTAFNRKNPKKAGDFKIIEIIQLAAALNVDEKFLFQIFTNSVP